MFKLSSEASLDGVIAVENKFIVEYMPYADGDYVKVYLYGLSLAARKDDKDDAPKVLARRLDLDIATVDAAIEYWSDLGLMTRLGDDITYSSLRSVRPKIKKYDVDKYREFNRQAQLYVAARQITPNEYNEYYSLMEKLDLEWQAMVLIVKYCVDLKGDNVSCPYILAVARNLAEDGYRSFDAVGNQLDEYGVYYNDLKSVLSVMGGKRPDHDSVQLYKKWRITYKFDLDLILHVAETVKKGGAAALDAKLTDYRDRGLLTVQKIDEFEAEKRDTYKLARAVNKALGVYYENVDPEIATYIKPWLELGMEKDAIIEIADYCLKSGLKTIPDLDSVVRDFLTVGALSTESVKNRIAHEHRYDEQITAVMNAIGQRGAVKPPYRALYSAWAEKLGMPDDVIMQAAKLSVGKTLAYIDGILAAWHKDGVTTVEKASAAGKPQTAPQGGFNGEVKESVTADELNALFIQIGEDK